jgi:hypothetical protein
MNRGLKNDPETMSELKAMQESPANARAFMANNPKGKHYLMRNQRPARMSSGIAEAVGTPNPSVREFSNIEFFNLLHIFGFEVKRDKQPKTPVLVGLQFVLTSGLNQNVAEKLTGEVQDLLMNPHSNIRHVFFDWCRLALSVYEEYNDWNERGNLNVARIQTGADEGIPPSIPESIPDSMDDEIPDIREAIAMADIHNISLDPHNPFSTPSSRQDAFRFLPPEEFVLEFPSKGNVPPVPQHAIAEAAHNGRDLTAETTDEGEDSSTLVLRNPSSGGESSSSASTNGARSTPTGLDSTVRPVDKGAYDAKQLIEKIKEVEHMANEWAKTQGDAKSSERVTELVTLREALCDDFAADLDLYIAFYCVSKELQEGERNQRSLVA